MFDVWYRHDLFLGAGRSVVTGAQVTEYMRNKLKTRGHNTNTNTNTNTPNASSRWLGVVVIYLIFTLLLNQIHLQSNVVFDI